MGGGIAIALAQVVAGGREADADHAVGGGEGHHLAAPGGAQLDLAAAVELGPFGGVAGDVEGAAGAVGAGLEYGFAPNWSAGIEYDHLFMQNRTNTFTTPAGTAVSTDRIRVYITGSLYWYSRVVEVEAWSAAAP